MCFSTSTKTHDGNGQMKKFHGSPKHRQTKPFSEMGLTLNEKITETKARVLALHLTSYELIRSLDSRKCPFRSSLQKQSKLP